MFVDATFLEDLLFCFFTLRYQFCHKILLIPFVELLLSLSFIIKSNNLSLIYNFQYRTQSKLIIKITHINCIQYLIFLL